jgi:hypothetical protein
MGGEGDGVGLVHDQAGVRYCTIEYRTRLMSFPQGVGKGGGTKYR